MLVLLLHEVALLLDVGLVGHQLNPVGLDVLLHVVALDKPSTTKITIKIYSIIRLLII